MSDAVEPRRDLRDRIVSAAAALLDSDGAAGVTTRAVADRAGVQAPTIYRLFGHKDGLLDAVAERALADFAAAKAMDADAAPDDEDALTDLRRGWDLTIQFGLSHPDLFVIMSDPTRGAGSPAVAAGLASLRTRLRRVAASGRLLVTEDEAIQLVHAAGTGAVIALLEQPPEHRDLRLADELFAAILGRIVAGAETDAAEDAASAPRSAALTLLAVADDLEALTPSERTLLSEWLTRVVQRSRSDGLRAT